MRCSKGANRRGYAAAVRARERPSAATLCRGSRRETATRSIRRSADSSPARRHGRRRASLAVPPAAPAAPLPKNLAALRFSGALFYLLRGFGGGLPSPHTFFLRTGGDVARARTGAAMPRLFARSEATLRRGAPLGVSAVAYHPHMPFLRAGGDVAKARTGAAMPRLFARASGHRPRRFAEAPEGKRQREASDAPPTRRRQGAMADGALRLPSRPLRLPLLFPKISLRCDFREPCFTSCGVSAGGATIPYMEKAALHGRLFQYKIINVIGTALPFCTSSLDWDDRGKWRGARAE